MTKPVHGLSTDEIERALLSAGRNVASPDRQALERTMSRVGGAALVGALATATGLRSAIAVGGGTSQAVASAASTVIPAGSGALASAKNAMPLIVGKWLAIGATAGLMSVGTTAVVAPTFSRLGPEQPARTTAATSRHPPNLPAVAGEQEAMTEVAQTLTVPSPASGSPPSPERRRPLATERMGLSAELAEELELLDASRTALARGDDQMALAWLDRHDQRFPHGQLGPEAATLRKKIAANAANGTPSDERRDHP